MMQTTWKELRRIYSTIFLLLLASSCRSTSNNNESADLASSNSGLRSRVELSGAALKSAVDLASMAKFNADKPKSQPFTFNGIIKCVEEQSYSPTDTYFFKQSCKISETANSSIFECSDDLAKPIIEALRQVSRVDGNPRIWTGTISATLKNASSPTGRTATIMLN